jgi:hypothetical protein
MAVNRPDKITYSPKGFKAKLSKKKIQIRTHTFLVTLTEIFILKITMYHKYTLIYQKYKKNVKKKHYYRLCSNSKYFDSLALKLLGLYVTLLDH